MRQGPAKTSQKTPRSPTIRPADWPEKTSSRAAAKRIDEQVKKVVDLMRQAGKARSLELMRQLAREVVELRSLFTWEGMADWAGRSQEYRNTIYQAYRSAGIPSDAIDGLQANLRYHVGNVVREIAPTNELEKLGMDPEGPKGRAVRARATAHLRPKRTTRQEPAPTPLAVMQDPLALCSFARDAVRAIRSLAPKREMADALVPELRALAEEVFGALADISR